MNLRTNLFASVNDQIRQALQKIDENGRQVVFVLDLEQRLCGAVTDGDVRRALLRGVDLDSPVTKIMNSKPRFILKGQLSRQASLNKMIKDGIKQLPVVEPDGRVVEIIMLDELVQSELKQNRAVILAGGQGSRLRPLTDEIPKPLLKIGGRSILDIQVDNFVSQGFQDLVVAVHYKADMIKAHLGEGESFGCSISYFEKHSPLGTAGPLSLLSQGHRSEPIILMNGDIITRLNFKALLNFHEVHNADLTVCAKKYESQVPYGVLRVDGDNLEVTGIEEKPTQQFFINAGIYVVEPNVIEMVPSGGRFDMPELIECARKNGLRVLVYPISEYWLDIGKPEDYHRAQVDYETYFKNV